MIIKKTFRFCLRPNKKQAALFRRFAGACRWVYNRCLARRQASWENDKQSISLFDQNKEMTFWKQLEETSWLKEIHSQVLQQSLDDLDKAFQHFFRRIKNQQTPGYPHFKRKGDKDSFRYPQGVRIVDDQAWLPKIGWVRFRKSREIAGKIKQTTVILDGGRWYVCFSCEWEEPIEANCFAENTIGIDLGLESFATIATDKEIFEISNPRFLKNDLNHLRYLSRQLSNKVFGSKNWQKGKAKLQSFWTKIRCRRQDFLHKLSTRLVKSHDIIVVESLKVKELLMASSRSLSRAIGDAGWRQFLQFLKYKSEYAGKQFVEAGRYFPSTQLCSHCGKKNPMELSKRVYSCVCGLEIHRDHNAALNLRAVGRTVPKACGAAL